LIRVTITLAPRHLTTTDDLQNLKPHWDKAATQLKGKVKLGAVDATVHSGLAQKYGIQGYPTIKYFPAGPKSDPEEYDGGRTSGDIVNWALERHTANIPPPEVVQITSNEALTKNCENHPLCVIAFLPHILDCQSKCRWPISRNSHFVRKVFEQIFIRL
jgi:protein disulfide-isomerase A6